MNIKINNLAKDDCRTEIVDRYKSLFKGIGKLKDFQLKILIDSSIEPVCQTARRTPYHLRGKLSQNGNICLCVDMRRANLAAKRERHPIPTIEELLQEMNQKDI